MNFTYHQSSICCRACCERDILLRFRPKRFTALEPMRRIQIAVARIFEAKQRPTFDPLIVHVAELSQVEQVVSRFP